MARTRRSDAVRGELEVIYRTHKGLNPAIVVEWARKHPRSVLYGRFEWDDSAAARRYRLWQARELITEVEVVYADGKVRQIYVSPIPCRGTTGYRSLVDVLATSAGRNQFLSQALAEYELLGRKYEDLCELAGVRRAVKAVANRLATA